MRHIDYQANAAIEVKDLTKFYGEVRAVDGISFEVRKGEFFGFLGPNGAGKTTTVRVLTGIISPDGGSARVMGHQAGSLKAKQLMGVVPEMANAYLDLTGWENLMLMAELYGISSGERKDRAAGLLRKLELLPRKDSLVRTYSKGMKQRLILCMALISDPEVLFLDEPTSGLDVQSTRLIRSMLRELNRAGKTIFLTTHDMDEANDLCQRVAIIRKGKVAAIDAPEKIRLATSKLHSVLVCLDGSVPEEEIKKLPGVNVLKIHGDKYRLYTDSPGNVVINLVNYCTDHDLRIISLSTLAPSLEDAFLALTGGESQ
ncbi:MAG: ATP-binding cassette domain-containing protein [Deltaproteobacteria bacterium]|nr:ATP-binding cassette domain-containing protein [Deltaproteobacteria bacterium]